MSTYKSSCVIVTTGMCVLDLDAGLSAALLSLKPVAVPLTASKPELSTGISCGIVVPLHHVVPTRSWIQGLAAALGWRQQKANVNKTVSGRFNACNKYFIGYVWR